MKINNKMKLMKKLGITSRRLMTHSLENGNEQIGRGQIGMLDTIIDHPGISQEELASELDLDKTTIAKAVKKLEMHGMLKRTKSETDGRKFEIYAEDKAKEMKNSMREHREKRCNLAFEGIDDASLEQFENTLDKIKENIDGNNLDLRKRKIDNIKKVINIISTTPGISKDDILKEAALHKIPFNRILDGLEKRGVTEVIDGKYYITEKAKDFDGKINKSRRINMDMIHSHKRM